MTNEEKIELRREVCARMFYGLKALVTKSNQVVSILRGGCYDNDIYYFIPNIPSVAFEIDDFKIYLRPMSSMTEEECKEIKYRWVDTHRCWDENDITDIINRGMVEVCDTSSFIDWLNEHHFDYRGLIVKGLALPAKEGMYETK